MTDSYDDAEPDETVFISGSGSIALRAAVRRYLTAHETGQTVMLFREIGKTPGTFDAVDVERLSHLKRFKVLKG